MSLRSLAFSFFWFSCFALLAVAQQATSSQGSIEGHSLSADGQPLRKTNLVLRPMPTFNGGRGGAGTAGGGQMPTPYGATSDASGKFSFTGLEPGRYTLSAEHSGYLNTQYGVKRTGSGMQAGNPIINLTAGQHITDINIQLTPEAMISGKVTDEDGDPMPRVRVSAMRRMYGFGGSRMASQGGGTTDETGEYHLGNLMPGRYYISFSQMRMGMFENTRRTGADASAPEMGYGTTYYPGSPDLVSAVAVDVGEGEEKNGINLRMRQTPVYHIRGKLTGDLPAAEPGPGPGRMGSRIQISATPPGGTMFGMNSQMAKPDGSFDISGLTPGTWTVSAMRMQGRVQMLGQSTVVISNQDVDVDLTARGTVDIPGVVRMVPEDASTSAQSSVPQNQSQNTAPGRGAAQGMGQVRQVRLQPENSGPGSNVQGAQVQADGSFKLTGVPPLAYRVSAGVPPGGYLKTATLNGQDALQHAVDMSSGGTLELVVSMTAAEVDGTVTGSDGQPATDAMVTLTPDPAQPDRSDLYRQARTRSDGGFTLRGLAPGKYRVFAWEEIEPGAYFDPDYMKPFESLGTEISVDDNDKKSVTLQEISKDKAAEVNRRAGH